MSGTGRVEQEGRQVDVDLSVDESDYFGARLSEIENTDLFGLERGPETDLYRVSYLYLLVFGNSESPTGYGGIQVRGQTYLYLEDGAVPLRFQRVMQRAAHRGAFIFDSSIEHPAYAGGGGEWGPGYLSGFTPVENGADYRNWEVEPVTHQNGSVGKIDWTVEVYLEVEGTQYAELSGTATGIANPWDLNERDEPGKEPVEAEQTWWQFSENFNQARGAYQIAPPGYTTARRRSQQLRGKTVYINGLPVGELDKEGRVWLKKEYQGGDTYRGQHSRESVIKNTPATVQSLALGRKIAKVDESPSAVYLQTAGARDEDFDPLDPDEIDVGREVRPGRPPRTIRLLALQDPSESTLIEVRQDREVIKHLGFSTPPYRHEVLDMWNYPGDRTIEEHGKIITPQEERDDGQAGLDDYGGEP